MTNPLLIVNRLLKLTLFSLLLAFSHSALAENTINFLGVDTEIEDRIIHQDETLSFILESAEDFCESYASKINVRHSNNEAKKRLRVQVRCLKVRINYLRSHKHKGHHHRTNHGHRGHHNNKVHKPITRDEVKNLLSIIQQFKENGGVINPPVVVLSTINGRVTSPSGQTIANVDISVGSNPTVLATTQEDGRFSIDVEADLEYALQLNADSYATQVVAVKSASESGSINLDFTMIQRGQVQTFTATTGGTFTGDDGASVTVLPNSFVDSNGNLVNGVIQLTVTSIDVSNSATLAAFPGEFSGVQSDGSQTPIISLGTVEYKFTKEDGEELQLDIANGATADILIPIYSNTLPDGTPINVDDTIPLWSLTEATGIWLQEGSGIVVESQSSPTGKALQATVTHFTWWNCDVTMSPAKANVTVNATFDGTANIKADASACDIGWRSSQVSTIVNIGQTATDLDIPDSCSVCFSAELTPITGAISNTDTQCVVADPNSVVNLTLGAISEGPLTIITNGLDVPQATASGILNNPVGRIQLTSGTVQNAVNYSIISGSLPTGLTLKDISETRAEISGVSTVAGTFTVEIQAINIEESETDIVTLVITITDPTASQLPVLVYDNITYAFIDVFNIESDAADDFSPYNVGAVATNWELIATDTPVPEDLNINPDGTFSISSFAGLDFSWSGIVRASNNFGSDEANVTLCFFGCISSPIPGDYAISGGVKNVTTNDSSVTLDIFLNQVYEEDITFDFETVDVTAQASVNYIAKNGSATMLAGKQVLQTITIDLTQNQILGVPLSFEVHLSNLSFGRFGSDVIKIYISGDDVLVD